MGSDELLLGHELFAANPVANPGSFPGRMAPNPGSTRIVSLMSTHIGPLNFELLAFPGIDLVRNV